MEKFGLDRGLTDIELEFDMNRLEHLLTIFSEECAEVAQETSKALRFGLEEKMPTETRNNRQRIAKEFSQLMAMREMLEDEGVKLPISVNVIDAKKSAVEKYLEYSKQCGTLSR